MSRKYWYDEIGANQGVSPHLKMWLTVDHGRLGVPCCLGENSLRFQGFQWQGFPSLRLHCSLH